MQRQDAITSFQKGDARFFVGNPQTAGYGLTLTAANNVIYYANDYNLETRMQSEDRCHRIGQIISVLYVDLVVPGHSGYKHSQVPSRQDQSCGGDSWVKK